MYTRHKIILVIAFCLIAFVVYYFDFKVDGDCISTMVTVVSIVFGFAMAAAVSLGESSFLRSQARKVDTDVGGILMSNAQRLGAYISCTGWTGMTAILVLLAMQVFNAPPCIRTGVYPVAAGLVVVTELSGLFILRVIVKFLNEMIAE